MGDTVLSSQQKKYHRGPWQSKLPAWLPVWSADCFTSTDPTLIAYSVWSRCDHFVDFRWIRLAAWIDCCMLPLPSFWFVVKVRYRCSSLVGRPIAMTRLNDTGCIRTPWSFMSSDIRHLRIQRHRMSQSYNVIKSYQCLRFSILKTCTCPRGA